MSRQDLGDGNILRLIINYSMPAIVATMVNVLYTITDRYFIGRYVGEDAFAGLTLTFPIMIFIISIAALISAGGSTLIAIKLGARKMDEANEVHANLITLMAITSIVTLVGGLLIFKKLFFYMGGDSLATQYGIQYMSISLFGIFFQLAAFTFGNIARTEGKPNLAMIAMLASGLSNILLDYILIKMLGYGVKGAAVGLIIAEFIGFAILSAYFFSGYSQLKVYKKNLILKLKYIKPIFQIGSVTFISTIGTSLAIAIHNKAALKYGGIDGVAAMGIIAAIDMIVFMPLIGLQQGVQPIIAFNHGAKAHKRVQDTVVYSIIIGTVFSVVTTIVIFILSPHLVTIFLDEAANATIIAKTGLRIFILGLPFVTLTLVGTAYLQGTLQPVKAFWLGFSRQLLFVVPLLMIFPRFMGLNGVWIVTPLEDFFTAIVALILIVPPLLRRHNASKLVQDDVLKNL